MIEGRISLLLIRYLHLGNSKIIRMAHLPRCDYVASSNTKACPVSESAPGRRRRRVRRLAMAMEGSHMTRNPTRLLPHLAATLLILSGFPDPTLAQTVSFIARGDFKVG